MSYRNLLPAVPRLPSGSEIQTNNDRATLNGFDAISNWMDAITRFIRKEHPRGDLPTGPLSVTAAAQADSIRISWRPEKSTATIKYFWVWRASAGTVGTPTTPGINAAVRQACLPATSWKPTTELTAEYSWFDLRWSAADRVAADKSRYSYWVSAVDSEDRESPLIPASAIITQP